jgi:hypothetical protein
MEPDDTGINSRGGENMEPKPIQLSNGVIALIKEAEAMLQMQIRCYIQADFASRDVKLPDGKWSISQDRSHILVGE